MKNSKGWPGIIHLVVVWLHTENGVHTTYIHLGQVLVQASLSHNRISVCPTPPSTLPTYQTGSCDSTILGGIRSNKMPTVRSLRPVPSPSSVYIPFLLPSSRCTTATASSSLLLAAIARIDRSVHPHTLRWCLLLQLCYPTHTHTPHTTFVHTVPHCTTDVR